MILQVTHFQLSSSPVFVNFGQNERFSEKQIYFWKKNENFIIFAPKSTQNTRRVVCNYSCEKNSEKVSSSIFANFFFHISKNPKISNLSRDKTPEFQNNVIVDMKTALDGGKKVKTQLFIRRGHNPKRMLFDFEKIVGSKWPPLDILGLKYAFLTSNWPSRPIKS